MKVARRSLVLFCAIGLLFNVLMQWWIAATLMFVGLILAGMSRD